MTYNDPWVALGTLIGTALGQGYKNHTRRRDNEKVDEYLTQQQQSQSMADINADTKEQIAQQIINADPNQQLRQSVSNTPSLVMNGNNLETQYKPFSANMYDQPTQEPLQKAVADIANIKAAADMRNVQKQNEMTPQQRADYNFNRAFTADSFKKWARNNISKEAYEARLPEVKNAIAASASAALLPEINKNLYGYTDEKGNRVAPTQDSIINGLAQIQELSVYDPDTAKEMKSLAHAQRNYVQQSADKEYWYNRQRQDKLSDMSFAASLRSVRSGGGGGGGRDSSSSSSKTFTGGKPMFNGQVITKEIRDNADKEMAAMVAEYGSSDKIPEEKKRAYNNNLTIVNRYDGFEEEQTIGARFDNLEAEMDGLVSNPDIINNYDAAVGPNGIFQNYYKQLVNEFHIPAAQAKVKVQQKLAEIYGPNSQFYGDWSDMNDLYSYKVDDRAEAQRQAQVDAAIKAEAEKQATLFPAKYSQGNTIEQKLSDAWERLKNGKPLWNLAHPND